jgi:hypothetical protein
MQARIATQLDRDAVFVSLGDLVSEGEFMDPRARLVGRLRPPELSVGYRTSMFFAPRLQIAAFLGRVVNARNGAIIEGAVEASLGAWLGYAMLALTTVISLGSAVLARDHVALLGFSAFWALGFLVWWAYVASTKKFIVKELCRASRGSVV